MKEISYQQIKFKEMCENITKRIDNPQEAKTDYYVGLEHLDSEEPRILRHGNPLDVSKTKFYFEKGDILFGRRNWYLRRLAVAEREGICSAHMMVLRSKNQKIIKNFLPILMFGDDFYQKALSISAGSMSPTIRWKELAEIDFLVPSISEQEKIVNLISNINDSITKTQHLLEKLKTYKNSKANELLTRGIGHTKFKKIKWFFEKEIEVPETWAKTTISEVAQLKTGGTPSRKKPEYFKGNIPWITSSDLNRGLITKTLESISQDAKEKTRLRIFPKGTFVIATYGLEAAGTRGKCGILNIDATINQACMAFLPLEKIDAKFLFYFYLEYGEIIAFNFAQGTKQQNLYPDTFKQIPIVLPPILEQQKIITILSNIDEQIKKLENHISKLKIMRKSIINKKLTPPKMEDKIVQ